MSQVTNVPGPIVIEEFSQSLSSLNANEEAENISEIRLENSGDITSLPKAAEEAEEQSQPSEQQAMPEPVLELSKSSMVNQPSYVDPKLDAVRKHIQQKAINMTKTLLEKAEVNSSAQTISPLTNFEEATRTEQAESISPWEEPNRTLLLDDKEESKTVWSLEKASDTVGKPLLRLEKGVENKAISSSPAPILSLEKETSVENSKTGSSSITKRRMKANTVLKSLGKNNKAAIVIVVGIFLARRILGSIFSRGMM